MFDVWPPPPVQTQHEEDPGGHEAGIHGELHERVVVVLPHTVVDPENDKPLWHYLVSHTRKAISPMAYLPSCQVKSTDSD